MTAYFSELGIFINIAIFAACCVIVWFAGTRLAGYADEISERTGLGEALIGLLLLAGVTSLPEIATSLTAAGIGNAPLAVNNLLGSIAMQVALLGLADAIYGKRALTSVVPDPVVMLQGSLNIILLSAVAVAAVIGDIAFAGGGAWSWSFALASLFAIHKLVEANDRKPWVANIKDDEFIEGGDHAPELQISNLRLGLMTGGMAILILAAGSIVALSGEAIAEQSGLGSSFMGYAFVAIATSLPEASTVFASMKRCLYTMAISDIFGTNILNILLIFIVDLVDTGAPVMQRVGNFSAVAALLGLTVTGLFIMGLAERRDRAFLRMGTDSIAVLITYLGGLGLLYSLKGAT